MSTYRLPDDLGGQEVEILKEREVWHGGKWVPGAMVRTASGREVSVLRSDLVEVLPPIPDEPQPGAYLIETLDGIEVGLLYIYETGSSVLVVMPGWRSDWIGWAEAWEKHIAPHCTIRRLVPESGA